MVFLRFLSDGVDGEAACAHVDPSWSISPLCTPLQHLRQPGTQYRPLRDPVGWQNDSPGYSPVGYVYTAGQTTLVHHSYISGPLREMQSSRPQLHTPTRLSLLPVLLCAGFFLFACDGVGGSGDPDMRYYEFVHTSPRRPL